MNSLNVLKLKSCVVAVYSAEVKASSQGSRKPISEAEAVHLWCSVMNYVSRVPTVLHCILLVNAVATVQSAFNNGRGKAVRHEVKHI